MGLRSEFAELDDGTKVPLIGGIFFAFMGVISCSWMFSVFESVFFVELLT